MFCQAQSLEMLPVLRMQLENNLLPLLTKHFLEAPFVCNNIKD